jgi:hypothetical protein
MGTIVTRALGDMSFESTMGAHRLNDSIRL